MASVRIRNMSFRYPVFQVGSRSLKLSLAGQLAGGRVARGSNVVHVEALTNVSFELKDGDRVGIVGHNGSGKSTMLRLLAGLAAPFSGEIEVQGRIVPLIERGMGIHPELSGMANIELPLRLLGATSAEVKRARAEIPEFTGLGDFINLPVRTYSEGMRARLSFAICTSIEADVLILDEWLSAGDIDFQERAQARLKSMVDRTRIVILASHSPELVMRSCNQALWLDRGQMVMIGDPSVVVPAYQRAVSRPVRLVG